MIKVLCGVPEDKCNAGLVSASNGLRKAIKAHSNHKEAMACYKRYLLSLGYVQQQNGREFLVPDGQPGAGSILVLTRLGNFGGELRTGKHAEGQKGGSRWMPERGGVIY